MHDVTFIQIIIVSGVSIIRDRRRPKIGDRINAIRTYRGKSQTELGILIFESRAKVSEIESGKIICSDEMLNRIRNALDFNNMPVLDSECREFLDSLNQWHNVIRVYAKTPVYNKQAKIHPKMI